MIVFVEVLHAVAAVAGVAGKATAVPLTEIAVQLPPAVTALMHTFAGTLAYEIVNVPAAGEATVTAPPQLSSALPLASTGTVLGNTPALERTAFPTFA